MRIVGVVCGVVTVCLILGCTGSTKDGAQPKEKDVQQKADDKSKPTQRETIDNTANFDNVKVTMEYAFVGTVMGRQYGNITNFNSLYCKVVIENTSDVKIVRWRGWQGDGKAEDEHGNVFKPISLTGYAFDYMPPAPDGDQRDIPGEAIADGTKVINPKTKVAALIFFEAPPPTSKEARITLSHSVVEKKSKQMVRFRLPIQRK